MTNQIIEAITTAIGEEFGDNYNIYTERIEQELNEPCFFVHQVTDDHELFLNIRYHDTHHFDVQYFPGSDAIQFECNDVANRLYSILEYIYLYDEDAKELESKPIRGGQMSSQMIDDVLHFHVYYNGFVKKVVDEDEMETLSQTTTPKDD